MEYTGDYRQQLISRKKQIYPVKPELRHYLVEYRRELPLPFSYADLKRFSGSLPIRDKKGRDTLWESALYQPADLLPLHEALKQVYSILKTEGDTSVHTHLHV